MRIQLFELVNETSQEMVSLAVKKAKVAKDVGRIGRIKNKQAKRANLMKLAMEFVGKEPELHAVVVAALKGDN